MLSLLNTYIAARVSINVLVKDAIVVFCPAKKESPSHAQTANRRFTATVSRRGLESNTLVPAGVSHNGLNDLEKQLQELATMAASPARSPSEGQTPCTTRKSVINHRASSSPQRTALQARNANIVVTQPKLQRKAVSQYTRDEVAIALLTKFQSA